MFWKSHHQTQCYSQIGQLTPDTHSKNHGGLSSIVCLRIKSNNDDGDRHASSQCEWQLTLSTEMIILELFSRSFQ